ncbi:MAG: Mrp/NBP35 family ATP-binding protein [Rhodothermales bacterium]
MKTYHDIPSDGGSDIVAQVTEQANRLRARMASIRHIVAIMSGKGGVGKSSVTVNLASALALQGETVGILDADINGASIARMTGVRGQSSASDTTGVQPATGALNLKVMSIDLFLPEDDTPVLWDAPTQKSAYAWRGMMEMAALRELLSDTEWGTLNYLLIDLPPGTDKLPNLVDLLPDLSGTIIVTIPSGVSQLVVSKSINMARQVLKTPVIGLVENMSAYICAHCGREEALFPVGRVEALASRHEIPFLGRIPFDPRIAAVADEGILFMQHYDETPAARAVRQLADRTRTFFS